MAATGKYAATPGDRAEAPTVAIGHPAAPLTEFRTALGLYGLWAALAWFSVVAGQTLFAQQSAIVLLVGVAATNAMFLLIARSSVLHRPPDRTITLAQGVMAITWTTLFSFMSAGPGELVLGMYVTAILFAVHRIRRRALVQLAAFALASYASVVLVKASLSAAALPLSAELVSVVVFACVVGSCLLLTGQLQAAPLRRSNKHNADNPDRSVDGAALTNIVNRRYIVESLEREKGRADRSNNPFSLCVLAIDSMDGLMRDHGSVVGALILQRFAKRVRGEMRAMDGVHSSGSRRSFDRVGAELYIAVLPQTSLAGASRCAERIRAATARYPIDGQFAVTISAGVVEYQRGETVTTLLERAETILSQAQAGGGDRVFGFEPTDSKPADVIPLRGIKI